MAKAEIARQLGISRNTVAKAIASTAPPEYARAAAVTSFAPFEVHVRQLLMETPSMPATVSAERVGWAGSPSWFRQNVADLRPDYAPTDPADRIVYHPGDQVQCEHEAVGIEQAVQAFSGHRPQPVSKWAHTTQFDRPAPEPTATQFFTRNSRKPLLAETRPASSD